MRNLTTRTTLFSLLFTLLIFWPGDKISAQDFMMQGWYWNYPKPDCNGYTGPSLAEIMAGKAEDQAEAGFTMIWMPPLTNASFGECSNGYDPRDLYDYGQVPHPAPGRTGLGTGNEVEAWIAAMANNDIYPIADVVYNHRDGGDWEDNPAVREYIMDYPWDGCPDDDGATPYPVNGKMRYRLPLGGDSGNGAGDYYFKFSSASGDTEFDGREYKLYFTTADTEFVDDPIFETEDNGGADCGQDNDQIWLGRDILAAQQVNDCNTDEFYLQLEADDFNEDGDFLDIYIEERGGGGTGIDQRIYGIWSGPRGEDIIDELKVQTRTDFTDMPSGEGAMHWRHFKPNGITHTCLTGDLDFPFFFFDVEQAYDGAQDGESTRQVYDDWNQWLWNTVGIRGFRLDAVKHFPAWFVGELLNDLHAAGIHPPMVVGEWFGTDTGELAGWVNEVYDHMNEPAKDDIIPRIFDFSLREALRQACDQFGYDVRDVYNASIVDQNLLNGINVVTFINNHDFRGDDGFSSLVQNDPILAYAYILTNNQLGLPNVFYPDYYGYPAPGEPGYKSYHPDDKDPLREEIDQLMHIHSEYIFGASSRTYLNAFGSSFSNNAGDDNSFIMTYQLKDGPAGFEDIVVAINFGGEAVSFNQELDNIPVGTHLTDLTGNAINEIAVVEASRNGVPNSISVELPGRSYAVWRSGAWGLFDADRSYIGFDVSGNEEFFNVWDNGTGDIQDHDFGSFQATDVLALDAYDIKTWKSDPGDVTGGQFFYTTYPKDDRPESPVFTGINFMFIEELDNPGDQKWGFSGENINLLNGLDAGEYTLEFYAEVYGNNPNKIEYDSNNGNNYLAHFELCGNPTDGGTIAESETICAGAEPSPFTSTAAATGHTGALEYKWQYSETGDSGPWTTIEDSDAETFEASALTTTTWFRRLARVDCQDDWDGAAESNVLEVTVELYHVYRSRQSGNWNDAGTWERSIDGGATWDESTVYPGEEAVNDCGDPIASIRDEHVVTLTSDIAFDGDVVVDDGGTLVTNVHVLSGDGDFTLSAGASLAVGSEDGLSADGSSGNIQMEGTLTYHPDANYIYTGTDEQVPGDGLPPTMANLTIDNPAGLTLSSNQTITGILYLTEGIIHTGDFVLIIENTSDDAIVGGSEDSFVNGTLVRGVDASNTDAYLFPIGNNPYTPVEIVFTQGSNTGTITATTTASLHPEFGSTIYDADQSVNRFWTLEATGIDEPFAYDATFTWIAGDEALAFDWESSLAGKWDGSSWDYPTVDARTEHSATIIGEASFSDFIIASCDLPDLPVITADLVIDAGESVQLEILSGDLNDATEWQWYSDACGDTPVGTGESITVSPSVSTTYYVRGEGGCAGTAGSCASVTVGVAEVAIPLSGWSLYLGMILILALIAYRAYRFAWRG